ncbi:MAG: helix-turn-helix transcriptional regulator [Thermoleophilaceae bacterium]
MAKDTEKLIRQLSLISFLMAERRPVSALEIKQDVEGYSQMNDEAFARRFYADRAELEALGIHLKVDKPAEGYYEAENYSLPPENFYLEAIEFTDEELGALRTSLALLDGEFAYAEPLRLALQQLSWGKPSPFDAPEERSVALAVTAGAGGRELSQRLSKVETAIFRRKTIVFDYYTIGRDAVESRKIDPYHLLYKGGQFYLIGWAHERDALRVFRVSRIRGKVGYSSKAEHDFNRPQDFDPRDYAIRTDWQLGEPIGRASIWLSDRVDWLALRHFGHAGEVTEADDGVVFETDYASARQMVSWVLGLGEHARVEGPPELVDEVRHRLELVIEGHSEAPELAPAVERPVEPVEDEDREPSPIRPERFARLVTLAGILIEAAREGHKLDVPGLCERLQVNEQELRQDIDVLNVVNFGGGSYVLYAEVQGEQIEVDPEPYGDNFARPARLLPLEAKALVAAIDLIGEHLPEGSLASARQKIVDALGQDPAHEGLQITTAKGDDSEVARVVSRAIAERRLLEIEHYKEEADEFTVRRVEPYKLMNGREGWYVHCYDPDKEDTRSFRLDRIRSATVLDEGFEPRPGIEPDIHGWPRTGEVADARTARVWMAPERARWAREDKRVVQELADGAAVVELPFAGHRYLAREILKEAGDAVVLEPDDARQAVLEAAEALAGAAKR